MEKNQNQSRLEGDNQLEIMDKVNQTFEKLSQDVRDMINQNDQESNNNQYS